MPSVGLYVDDNLYNETYSVFSALLALNRILHIVSASRLERILFGPIGMKVWFVVAVLIWVFHFACGQSPLLAYLFVPDTFLSFYDGTPWAMDVMTWITTVETMGSFIVTAALHFLIFFYVLIMRMTSGFTWSGTEKKVLAQASVIALYDVGTTLPWSFLVSL